MTTFSSRNVSSALVEAPRSDIWAQVSDPQRLAELTPLLDRIEVSDDGARWTWYLGGISALGVEVAPSFTEAMTFDAPSIIRFRHDPPADAKEFASAEGEYHLTEVGPSCTRLDIDLTLSVDLPLPRLVRSTVERIMSLTMTRTGDVFARRLYDALGLDPSGINRHTTIGATTADDAATVGEFA